MEKGYEELFTDLHIHSCFSRACSKDLNLNNLVKWARIKGINLLGTGDFTHHKWLEELKENLIDSKNGIYYFEDSQGKFPFILTHEISLIYTQDGKGRKVHLVYLVPNFEAVDKINAWLDTKGRRDYDGRPIFKISCRDFVAKMEKIDDRIEIIPAHAWTPYFGIFGSMSGFDSLKQAFGDKVNRIHAIETGISSDPKMNWKIKELTDRNISIVSFSDLHSYWPWRLGREATIFKLEENQELSYDLILKQIRENSFIGTVETDPAYGKYHLDGHANCSFSCLPFESVKLGNKCPKCGRSLVIGVDNRVEKLAGLGSGVYEDGKKKKYYTLLPLHEILGLGLGKGLNTKTVWAVYDKLIENFGDEFSVLLHVSGEQLMRVLDSELVVDLILRNRIGEIKVKPGYDGVYGVPILDEIETKENNKIEVSGVGKGEVQKRLF